MKPHIPDAVEAEDVQYVNQHHQRYLFSCCRSMSSPGKGKKRRVPASFVKTKKKLSVTSLSSGRPSFETTPEKSFEVSGTKTSGRDRRNSLVFQGDIINNFNCMYTDEL